MRALRAIEEVNVDPHRLAVARETDGEGAIPPGLAHLVDVQGFLALGPRRAIDGLPRIRRDPRFGYDPHDLDRRGPGLLGRQGPLYRHTEGVRFETGAFVA